jgi:hypothetical protein
MITHRLYSVTQEQNLCLSITREEEIDGIFFIIKATIEVHNLIKNK